MHIAEGILPAEWAVAWAVPAVAATAVGVKRLQERTEREPSVKPLVAMMGAAVFAISLMPIPVPVAGSVSHPAGTPLAAIVVGPFAAVVLAAISLLLQALFFAHGGLTTLGANIMSEGVAGAFVGFGVFWLARRSGRSLFTAGFLAGALGDLAVYMVTAVELSLGLFPVTDFGSRFVALFIAFLPTQLPLAIVEGVATGAVLRSLAELRPDIARALRLDRTRRARTEQTAPGVRARWRGLSRGARWVIGVPLSLLTAYVGWALLWNLATKTGGWVGLDEGVMETAAEEAGRPAWEPFINTDVGGLLFIVFLLGGLVAGFALGWIFAGMRRAAGREGRRAPALGVFALSLATLVALLIIGPVRVGEWGGDLGLFLFLLSGLAAGGSLGLAVRREPGIRPRLRLGHVHGSDITGTDHLAWHARGLGRVDARIKLAFLLPLLFLNLLGGWRVSAAMLVLVLAVLFGWQRVRVLTVAIRLLPALVVGAVLIALKSVSVPGRALVSIDTGFFGAISVTAEGLADGAQLALAVLAGVSLVLLLGLTTPLPALIQGLRWYRTPPILIELGLMMYRYLFLFVEETERMRDAQRLRAPGVPWRRALGGYGALGAKLMARSYDRAQRVHDAQRLRGAR